MSTQKDIKHVASVMRKSRSELVSKSRIRQLGIGYKIRDGKLTDNVGIVVYVSKKPDENTLLSQHIKPIPKEIDGVLTDVIEVKFVPRSTVVPDDARHRPITGGIATIRSPEPATGTLGLVLKKGKGNAAKLYGITNNHVGAGEDVDGMSPAAAKKGDLWIQPGAHGNGRTPQDTIAKLFMWNRLKPSAPGKVNYYDFAMGQIITGGLPGALPNDITEIGAVKGMQDTTLDDRVIKRGRTTLKTVGKVVQLIVPPGTVSVTYNGYPCDFTDQVVISGDPDPRVPFSLAGDSGSVIVSADPDTQRNKYVAKALLFAGGPTSDGIDLTIASPIKRIAKDFKFTI
jgi:hypothetical protein